MSSKYRWWEILDEMPEGWVVDRTAGSPLSDCVFITNGKSVLRGQKRIYNKFDGLCAYSGTPLKDDWQIDHMIPRSLVRINIRGDLGGYINGKWVKLDSYDDEVNLVPCQRIINHYKRAMDPHTFKEWRLSTLHERLKKLPKNPRVQRSIRHKEYLLEIASYFGITPDKPFDGKFYYEKLNNQ